MPLRNREENETQDLGGVLTAADDTKVQFGRFVQLTNWVAGKLKSIKKKRGVTPFQGNTTPAFKFQDNFTRTDCSAAFGTAVCDSSAITIASGIATIPNGCGFFVCPCSATNGQFVKATYKDTRVGTPVSGLFLAVDPTSTRTNFTGYGLIYDQSQATNKLAIYKWVNASLATTGTLLKKANSSDAVSNTTLSTNDILVFVRDSGGNFTVYRQGSSAVLINTVNDTAIPVTNSCIGLAGVGTLATSTQNWTLFVGGCDASLGYAATTCNCEIEEIRLPEVKGCLDFIVDCYDYGSYTPTQKLNGERACGCCSGDMQRFIDPGVSITIRSGDTRNTDGVTATPLGGFSVWFGSTIGSTTDPSYQMEGGLHIGAPTQGKPIYGICYDVDPSSTSCNFNGYAVLWDYRANVVKAVQLVNYDLTNNTGTMTVRASTALSNVRVPTSVDVVNSPTGTPFMSIVSSPTSLAPFDLNFGTDDTPAGPVTATAPSAQVNFSGMGFIWLGNPDYGIHEATMAHDGGSIDENFNFE